MGSKGTSVWQALDACNSQATRTPQEVLHAAQRSGLTQPRFQPRFLLIGSPFRPREDGGCQAGAPTSQRGFSRRGSSQSRWKHNRPIPTG